MSLLMTHAPSLLLPKRLTPLKKRAVRKSRRATKRVRAAEDESKATKPEAKTEKPKAAGFQVNGTPAGNSATPVAKSGLNVVAGRLLESMKFRGGAPELINGRCAMIAIPAVIGYEMVQKEQFLQLIADHKLLFGAVIGLIAIASLIPIARGSKTEALGFMTPEAELINGRAAMIGILSILILEAKSGTTFF